MKVRVIYPPARPADAASASPMTRAASAASAPTPANKPPTGRASAPPSRPASEPTRTPAATPAKRPAGRATAPAALHHRTPGPAAPACSVGPAAATAGRTPFTTTRPAHDRARRRYDGLHAKADSTGFPEEAAACRTKAEQLRA